ncbi:MAG: DUF1295 domain-containing protein [Pseudomonadales bacterium]|nr:DUF1295 domain-containing protein [Pseudomonadales bacterium]
MHTDMRHIYMAYGLTLAVGTAALLLLPYTPLWNALIADVIATAIIFAFSRYHKNSSFYDAYWSVIPPLLMLYWMMTGPNADDLRVWLVFALVNFWAIRLTWNWASHWQGLSHEDWRYSDLRNNVPASLAPCLDFIAIHLLPTLQVFVACLPMYIISQYPVSAFNGLDIIAAAVTFFAVLIELFSDIQLHRFLGQRKAGEFINSGLWSWSRHPNYFGELSFWCGLMLFGFAASPAHYLWFIPGAVLMTLMIVFISIPMMDERSAVRRPGYSEHIKKVSRLIPMPPRKASH